MKKFKLFIITFIIGFIIINGIMLYHDTFIIDVNEANLSSSKVSPNLHGFKIVQFGDTHYSQKVTAKNVDYLVNKINNTKPDIIIFTGDLIKHKLSVDQQNIIANSLKKLTASTTKLAILGEDDTTVSKNILTTSGFNLLENKLVTVYNYSKQPLYFFGSNASTTTEELSSLKDTNLKGQLFIVLNHNPEYTDLFLKYNPDYIFSGHTHNQEINLPFIGVTDSLDSKYPNRHHQIGKTNLYITHGVGFDVYPLRFNSHPEIDLYRLLKKN